MLTNAFDFSGNLWHINEAVKALQIAFQKDFHLNSSDQPAQVTQNLQQGYNDAIHLLSRWAPAQQESARRIYNQAIKRTVWSYIFGIGGATIFLVAIMAYVVSGISKVPAASFADDALIAIFAAPFFAYFIWSFYWGWVVMWRWFRGIIAGSKIVMYLVSFILLPLLATVAFSYGIFGGSIYRFLKARRMLRGFTTAAHISSRLG